MTEKIVRGVLRPYPRWYVYIHFDPRRTRRGEPEGPDDVVYIGKGTRARAWSDMRLNSPDHRRWLRDLQIQGFSPDKFVRIEKGNLTPEEAGEFERQLIASYRDKGVLLFNKERGWKGRVRTYENKWMPDPEFGTIRRTRRPQGRTGEAAHSKTELMTEGDFKKAALRTEDDTIVKYDLRPFEDQQQRAVAWYLGNLSFRLSIHAIKTPSKAVVLLVDTGFETTRQVSRRVKRLKAARLPVEVRCTSPAPAKP